jgi:NAD(P)H-dependent FMN reductase
LPISIGVILASVREGRRGAGIAGWIQELIAERPDVTVELLDLKEFHFRGYAFPDSAPAAEKKYEVGSLERRWADRIAAQDAFVIVTPEYSHGYSGVLKNALDHVYAGWNYKPVTFVSYGGFAAGARAVEQLRLVSIELRMVPIREEVNLRLIGLATNERGQPTEELYKKRAAAMIDELLWWTRMAKDGRERHPR